MLALVVVLGILDGIGTGVLIIQVQTMLVVRAWNNAFRGPLCRLVEL